MKRNGFTGNGVTLRGGHVWKQPGFYVVLFLIIMTFMVVVNVGASNDKPHRPHPGDDVDACVENGTCGPSDHGRGNSDGVCPNGRGVERGEPDCATNEEPAPDPTPDPEPPSDPTPVPDPDPDPNPTPEPLPTPDPGPDPLPDPDPEPVPDPEPEPSPNPSPASPVADTVYDVCEFDGCCPEVVNINIYISSPITDTLIFEYEVEGNHGTISATND